MTTFSRPGSEAYDAATAVFNLACPAEPDAAVTARTVDDIRAALRFARAEGLGVRTQTTGHGSATVHPMRGSVLVRTQLAGGVEIDAAARVVRVTAGTRWADVVDAAAPHGLAAPHGSSPLIGAVGFLLRGGVSFYGRRIGVAANSVRAIELVTADGELRRIDAGADPELFWAIRGGGGGFGVVTAIEVSLVPAHKVVTGAAYWHGEHAARVLPAWLRWAKDAPWDASTSLRVMNLPDLPVVPEALRARTVVCVDGVVVSPGEDVPAAERIAGDLLEPLRAVAAPVLDTWETTDAPAAVHTHMDPTEPFPIYGDHLLLDGFDDAGAEAYLRAVSSGGGVLTNAELRQLGGALAVPDPDGGVLDHFEAGFAYMGGGVPFGCTPEDITAACATVREALGPWDTGRTAPTFVEHISQPQGHLGADALAAVAAVRARVDPGGLFGGDVTTR
jgi:FAD/FMN-containing dehydrogenase